MLSYCVVVQISYCLARASQRKMLVFVFVIKYVHLANVEHCRERECGVQLSTCIIIYRYGFCKLISLKERIFSYILKIGSEKEKVASRDMFIVTGIYCIFGLEATVVYPQTPVHSGSLNSIDQYLGSSVEETEGMTT